MRKKPDLSFHISWKSEAKNLVAEIMVKLAPDQIIEISIPLVGKADIPHEMRMQTLLSKVDQMQKNARGLAQTMKQFIAQKDTVAETPQERLAVLNALKALVAKKDWESMSFR